MKEDKKVAVLECYPCVQGEGRYAGVPHILIRTTGCKLRCMFKNSVCDTLFASWFPEKGLFTIEDIKKVYEVNPQISYTLISGGGPTLHPELLSELVRVAKEYDHFVTIETEGSEYVETEADFISLSPKLKSSVPIEGYKVEYLNRKRIITKEEVQRHEEGRTNYEAMKKFIKAFTVRDSTTYTGYQVDYQFNYQFKFVITDLEDIKEILHIQRLLSFSDEAIYLMPEGIVNSQLQLQRKDIIEECIKRGWNYSDRLHIIAYGNKRGV